MNDIKISKQLADALLNYLASKPFAEVVGFINAIQAAYKEEPKKD